MISLRLASFNLHLSNNIRSASKLSSSIAAPSPRTSLISPVIPYTFRAFQIRLASSTKKPSKAGKMSTKDNQKFTRDHLFDLSGKVALVTGGGSGIGLMATQALAANGAKVYITGRTQSKLDTVVEKYGKDVPGEIIPIQADVSTKKGVSKLYEEYSKREKCLCILVNNAGVSSASMQTESSSAAEMRANIFENEKSTNADWNDVYNTNVTAVFFVATAFLDLLEKSTKTHDHWSSTIINITSISGLIKSAQHHFSYNASKGAAVHLTRLLASEIASNGIKIRVNSIAPGVFPSEMTTEGSDEDQKSHIPKDKYAEKVPAQRPGKDEDMAQSVLFFATNQYLNGQTLAVDGGYTLAAGL